MARDFEEYARANNYPGYGRFPKIEELKPVKWTPKWEDLTPLSQEELNALNSYGLVSENKTCNATIRSFDDRKTEVSSNSTWLYSTDPTDALYSGFALLVAAVLWLLLKKWSAWLTS